MKAKIVQLLLPLFKEVIIMLLEELKEWLEKELKTDKDEDQK